MWSIGAIGYLMLTGGIPPFNGKDENEIYEKVESGNWSKETLVNAGASADAIDFIENLLQLDLSKRFTPE